MNGCHFVLSTCTAGHSTVSVGLLEDARIPTKCSSPGWKATPHDVTTNVGSYVYFNCRSSIPHKKVVWLYRGREIDASSHLANRIKTYSGNTSLQFGPVTADDHGLVIGCKVVSNVYGPLPSKVGKISVMSKLFTVNNLCG